MGEVATQRLIGLNNYVPLFTGTAPQPTNSNAIRVDSKYMRPITADDNYKMFSELEGNEYYLDTYLEFALASYYSPAVVQIRPPEADAILPANNPKLADQILGANVLKQIQILRFLASTGSATATAAVGQQEGMLKFITDRGNVTRADIETYYRNNIRTLISETVNEEFNKISFMLDNTTTRTSYNAVLTRNPQTGVYILEYERLETKYEPITANSLEALSSAMSRNSNFDQTSRNQVRTQAALIPAVAYPSAVRDKAVNLLTAFYLNPNAGTAGALYDEYENLFHDRNEEKGQAAADSFYRSLAALNREVADRILDY